MLEQAMDICSATALFTSSVHLDGLSLCFASSSPYSAVARVKSLEGAMEQLHVCYIILPPGLKHSVIIRNA